MMTTHTTAAGLFGEFQAGTPVQFHGEYPGRIYDGMVVEVVTPGAGGTVRVWWTPESRRPTWPADTFSPETTEVGTGNSRLEVAHHPKAANYIRKAYEAERISAA